MSTEDRFCGRGKIRRGRFKTGNKKSGTHQGVPYGNFACGEYLAPCRRLCCRTPLYGADTNPCTCDTLETAPKRAAKWFPKAGQVPCSMSVRDTITPKIKKY
ncbi:MAG: hypothetical protein PUJ21_04205 [Clostridia bacterium]|nr:hypothetical protein [Clostridia bacterium]MDY6184491.1 hypothetical protein [Eubacteriales bacterium]